MIRHDQGRFHISEAGISHPLWDVGLVRWTEVWNVFVRMDRDREYVCIVIRDRAALRKKMGILRRFFHQATRATGFGDLTIDVRSTGINATEVLEFANRMLGKAEEKAAQPGATDNPDDAQRLQEDH